MWRVVREWINEQKVTRSFDQGENADGQNKTMWPKGTGHSNAIRAAVQLCWRWCDIQQDPELLWTKRGRLTEPLQITVIWLSTDSRYSKAADESCVYQKEFWYRGKELRNRWTEKLLTKMLSTGARVSAKARDENEWEAHDVWEFRR